MQTHLLEMKPPMIDLSPDTRNRSILELALNEFQVGNQLRQSYKVDQSLTSFMFAPSDIDNRVHNIRVLLGYEPNFLFDEEMTMLFTAFYTKVEEGATFLDLVEIVEPTNP